MTNFYFAIFHHQTFFSSLFLFFCSRPQISWTFTPRSRDIPINLADFNNELKYVNVSVTKHDGIYNCSTESDFQVNMTIRVFFFLPKSSPWLKVYLTKKNSSFPKKLFDVFIVMPPKFKFEPSSSTYSSKVLASMKFNCSAYGDPPPEVDWWVTIV